MSQSFYGGVAGRPFILKRSFPTIKAMIQDFRDDAQTEKDYKSDVGFGEYVIIESKNRNNPEHGRIFRRALDQTNHTTIDYWEYDSEKKIWIKQTDEKEEKYNGAVYVGQITGPSGDAPHFASLPAKIQAKNEDGSLQYDEDNNPVYIKDAETKNDKIFEYDDILDYYQHDENGNLPLENGIFDLHTGEGEFTVNNEHLIPGKDEDGFNDAITWKWCSVRDELGQESIAYIGFTFPYMVVEWEATSVNPYYERDNQTHIFTNKNLVVRHDKDDCTHPFYQKWQLFIPKGIHGVSVENVYVTIATSDIVIFDLDENNKIQRNDRGVIKTKSYTIENGPNQEDDIEHGRHIIVCDVIDYDKNPDGDKYIIYLGDYNMIKEGGITLNNDGTFRIKYLHDNDYVSRLKWPTNIKVEENGQVTTEYTYGESTTSPDVQFTWITEASLDNVDNNGDNIPDDLRLKIQYNNNIFNPVDVSLRSVNDIIFKDGGIYAQYNIVTEQDGNKYYIAEYKGAIDEAYMNIVAGATEEEVQPSSLRTGGMWLVTEKSLQKPAVLISTADEMLIDSNQMHLIAWTNDNMLQEGEVE